jgi:hypothetical protein
MSVIVAPGTAESRPFVRLKSGEYCEFFTTPCMLRAESDYGREKVDALRKEILDDFRRAHDMKTTD